MSKEITLFNEPIQNPKIIIDSENLASILEEIEELKNINFDLTTREGVEGLKELKSVAAKWIKNFKEKCAPFEHEGKKIMDARSKISTALISGKESVINTMLKPITDIEKKLKDLNFSIVTPINDLDSCHARAQELEILKSHDWLAYKKQAEILIEQQEILIQSSREKIEKKLAEEEKQQNIERWNREAEIAKNATKQAEQETEARGKIFEKIATRQTKEHQRKIHNEIFNVISKLPYYSEDEYIKDIIRAVANEKIPHLFIKY